MTTTSEFVDLAAEILDEQLSLDPVTATSLGDHRFDDRLPATGPEARAEELTTRRIRLAQLDALPDAFDAEERVDREILTHHLRRRVFELTELRDHEWNPLEANPGTALYLLTAREFAPLADRMRSAAGRLAAIPATLAQARADLRDMPAIHVETAIGQFTGTRTLVATELGAVEGSDAAVAALDEHLAWLNDQLPDASGDPRLGPE